MFIKEKNRSYQQVSLLIISAVSASFTYADGPTLYGKINVSVNQIKNDLNTKSTITVDSNASRFGIKGSEKLTDQLSAIYGIEWGVVIDNNSTNSNTDAISGSTGGKASNGGGTTTELSARNRFIGLQYQGVGAFKVGRLDSYVKTSQNGVDIFDDLVNGNLDMTQTLAGENRINNVIAFESVKFDLAGFGALQGNILVAPSDTTVAKNATGKRGTNGVSASILYTQQDLGVYASLAANHNVSSNWNGIGSFASATNPVLPSLFATGTPQTLNIKNDTDIIRAVGSIDLSKAGLTGLSLNGLIQHAKIADTTGLTADPKETSYLVSAVYQFPASVLDGLSAKLQWQTSTTSDISATAADVKINQVGADLDYAFSKKTKVYGFYAKRSLKNPNNPLIAANGVDRDFAYSALGLGLEQKF